MIYTKVAYVTFCLFLVVIMHYQYIVFLIGSCVPAVRKLVTEAGLIICQYTVRRTQYDRLAQQQQLSFPFIFVTFLLRFSDSNFNYNVVVHLLSLRYL